MATVTPETALAISQKKALYGHLADTKRFVGTDGKPITLGRSSSSPLRFSSTGAFLAHFIEFFAGLQTGSTTSGRAHFEPGDAADEVRAVFALQDDLYHARLGSLAHITGGGFYYETWKLVDGEWYLRDLRMERTYQNMTLLVHIALFLQTWLGLSLL
ncbi:hypothetical protein F4778DRAFT_789242 [Xylariomycetidae sp. FL2044]|nr:hypothetical protein F4778DRAFT_789242 [Xylariomycetidae sp. FL2044]